MNNIKDFSSIIRSLTELDDVFKRKSTCNAVDAAFCNQIINNQDQNPAIQKTSIPITQIQLNTSNPAISEDACREILDSHAVIKDVFNTAHSVKQPQKVLAFSEKLKEMQNGISEFFAKFPSRNDKVYWLKDIIKETFNFIAANKQAISDNLIDVEQALSLNQLDECIENCLAGERKNNPRPTRISRVLRRFDKNDQLENLKKIFKLMAVIARQEKSIFEVLFEFPEPLKVNLALNQLPQKNDLKSLQNEMDQKSAKSSEFTLKEYVGQLDQLKKDIINYNGIDAPAVEDKIECIKLILRLQQTVKLAMTNDPFNELFSLLINPKKMSFLSEEDSLRNQIEAAARDVCLESEGMPIAMTSHLKENEEQLKNAFKHSQGSYVKYETILEPNMRCFANLYVSFLNAEGEGNSPIVHPLPKSLCTYGESFAWVAILNGVPLVHFLTGNKVYIDKRIAPLAVTKICLNKNNQITERMNGFLEKCSQEDSRIPKTLDQFDSMMRNPLQKMLSCNEPPDFAEIEKLKAIFNLLSERKESYSELKLNSKDRYNNHLHDDKILELFKIFEYLLKLTQENKIL